MAEEEQTNQPEEQPAEQAAAPADAPNVLADPKPEISTEEAAATLEANRQARIGSCTAEIQEALVKYNCELDVAMVIRAGSANPQVQVVAK